MSTNQNFDLLWYINLTMSQSIEVIEKGNIELAIQFLNAVKKQIAEACPEAMQASEKTQE